MVDITEGKVLSQSPLSLYNLSIPAESSKLIISKNTLRNCGSIIAVKTKQTFPI